MGDYNVSDLYDKFHSLFEPYEVKDKLVLSGQGEQVIKINCYEDQLVIDDRTGERRLIKGNRFNNYTGPQEYILDESLNFSFERLLHLIKINDKVRSEGYEGITTLKPEYQNYMRILFGKKKKTYSNGTGIKFFSCVPKNRISISEGEVEKMREFLKKNVSEKYFTKWAYCIESGKHPDKPNLHFHLLGHYNDNGRKNFRGRVLREFWNKHYPNNPLEWKQGNRVGIDRKDCNDKQMIKDKLLYFHNESKGTHTNFIDLEIYEEYGDWSLFREG